MATALAAAFLQWRQFLLGVAAGLAQNRKPTARVTRPKKPGPPLRRSYRCLAHVSG